MRLHSSEVQLLVVLHGDREAVLEALVPRTVTACFWMICCVMAVGAVLVRVQGPAGHVAAPAGPPDPCHDSAAGSVSSGRAREGWADGAAAMA